MLNVNALQKTLSAMSLPEIQKYASMHKDDPYVVAMALSVANTKKQAMLAQQGTAASGMAAQPTVVEQDLAGLAAPAAYSEVSYAKGATPTKYEQVPYAEGAAQLPEDSGIGQLPADNLQGMAEGGIVAFGDGGGVETQYWFNPDSGEMEEYVPDTKGFFSRVGTSIGNVAQAAAEKIPGYGKGLELNPLKDRPDIQADLQKEIAARAAPAETPKPTQAATPSAAGAGRGSYAGFDPRLAQAGVGGIKLPKGDKELPPAPTGVPSAGGAGLGGFMDFLKANKPAGPEDMDAYMKRRADYLGENPTKKQMERIDKQEAAALADKEEAKSMAIIRAGLGMMAGTSRHAFTNIGQGATAGLEDYIASQKDAKKLKLERDKMRDAVENAAYAYKKGDMDAYEKYAQDAKNAQNTYAAHGLSALGSVTGAQIHAGATLGAANINAGSTRDYINAIRGGNLVETTRKNIAAEIQKAMPYATEAERDAAFQRKWQATLQANPVLAQLSGGATGGGGAVDTSGFKVVGVR